MILLQLQLSDISIDLGGLFFVFKIGKRVFVSRIFVNYRLDIWLKFVGIVAYFYFGQITSADYFRVNTLGETVTSAQQLVTIVPDNTPNEMICYVKNTDIADVELGMEAEIKLEAYPYNKYGTVKGTVKYISPSSFANEQLGSVYIVKLEIDDSNENINIISGLSGAVEVKTDKRTVMDYFLEPIIKGFGDSLKEK